MGKSYFQPYKVRRVPGSKKLYQVCKYGLIGGVEIMPGYFDTVAGAQAFADTMNKMHGEVLLHV